jgi:hypothetical protein
LAVPGPAASQRLDGFNVVVTGSHPYGGEAAERALAAARRRADETETRKSKTVGQRAQTGTDPRCGAGRLRGVGASRQTANMLMVDCFAHATGLLLLLHTGRIRMFGASAPDLMGAYIREKVLQLSES